MAEKFLNLGREMDIQIHEAQRTWIRLLLRHIYNLIVRSQRQSKGFESSKRKETRYMHVNTPISLRQISQQKIFRLREWEDILKIMKEKTYQPRILYPVKLSLRNEREIKASLNKWKLRDLIITRPFLIKNAKEISLIGSKGTLINLMKI